jgi:HlyD family secretion protein
MKRALLILTPILVLFGAWFFFLRGAGDDGEVEYRYAAIEAGELRRSISATGQLVALTKVDVKSKAGGEVVRLAVDEGDFVRQGQLIAVINPEDTRAMYEQAAADLTSAQARATQARDNYQLQVATSRTSIQDAEAALTAARSRLTRTELEYQRQPTMARSALDSAQAQLDSAQQDLERFNNVTAPQRRRDAQAAVTRAESAYRTAEAALKRQEELLGRGYVSQAAVDQARLAQASAVADQDVARQRMSTLDQELRAEQRSLQLAADRARAALEQARAGQSDVAISQQQLQEARTAVRQAEIALQRARDSQRNDSIRQSEIRAAEAATTRSRVSAQNARVQLNSTTVVAPRDGVVTMKYLEEGTIIPPGASMFAQGTSLVEISDVTELYVECAVDEADFANVRPGQPVRILAEAFPGQPFEGVVDRVAPAAVTEQNLTAVKVRVRVLPGAQAKVLPGMNATCEFITMQKPNVLIVPSQAIIREDGKTFVRVRGDDPLKPVMKEIKLGDQGNDGVEVVEGLREGEEVVVAELNLRELREIQQRMLDAQQGGGLAGGAQRPGGRSLGGARSTATTGGAAR